MSKRGGNGGLPTPDMVEVKGNKLRLRDTSDSTAAELQGVAQVEDAREPRQRQWASACPRGAWFADGPREPSGGKGGRF